MTQRTSKPDDLLAAGRDAELEEQAMRGAGDAAQRAHPRGLYLLFVTEMWERFSYYGMRALLVLYLITSTQGMADKPPGFNPGRGWPKPDANVLYGWYTGLAYLLPIIGGLIADRLIGTHRSMLVGGVIIALGHISLAISGIGEWSQNQTGMSIFVFGLALIVIGTGHFKPTVSVMVGQLYPPKDPRRDGAYTIFYMGINVGAFICAFVCGTLGEKVGWHWGFGSAAVGMLAGLIVYLIGRPALLQAIGLPPPGKPNVAPLFLLTAVIIAGGFAWIFHVNGFLGLRDAMAQVMGEPIRARLIWLALVGLVLALAAWFVAIQQPGDKGPTACILIFIFFNAFFWMAFEQAGSSLNLFAAENTNRHILGWQMPATWFQSVNPFLVIALAPVFAGLWSYLGRHNLNPSQPIKIAAGLLLLAGGYVFMVLGGKFAATGIQVSMFWLLATYTLHTFGELCLSPTGLSFVTKAAPVRYVSLLMGLWFLANFIANLGGGITASYVEGIERGEVDLPWYSWFRVGGQADYFLFFVVAPAAAALVLLIFSPILKRLLHGRG